MQNKKAPDMPLENKEKDLRLNQSLPSKLKRLMTTNVSELLNTSSSITSRLKKRVGDFSDKEARILIESGKHDVLGENLHQFKHLSPKVVEYLIKGGKYGSDYTYIKKIISHPNVFTSLFDDFDSSFSLLITVINKQLFTYKDYRGQQYYSWNEFLMQNINKFPFNIGPKAAATLLYNIIIINHDYQTNAPKNKKLYKEMKKKFNSRTTDYEIVNQLLDFPNMDEKILKNLIYINDSKFDTESLHKLCDRLSAKGFKHLRHELLANKSLIKNK